jgi:hypothetical protein
LFACKPNFVRGNGRVGVIIECFSSDDFTEENKKTEGAVKVFENHPKTKNNNFLRAINKEFLFWHLHVK